MSFLVTGAAGFIGFHTAQALLARGEAVVGVDSITDYYDPELKLARLKELQKNVRFSFERIDLADHAKVAVVFGERTPRVCIHLAAQPGVRYSLRKPFEYVDANITGTLSVLEACRHHPVGHLVYASSSSVYGVNSKTPFSTEDRVDSPVSLYAATKRATELIAHTYSHLFRIPATGLRFFTVYGPWGRPDMAYTSFTDAILKGTPIDLFNDGHMLRDFTYVDDIVEGVLRVASRPPVVEAGSVPARLYNIGNSSPIPLEEMVTTLEEVLGKKAIRRYLPMQAGDVPTTYADVADLERDFGFRPRTALREGLTRFAKWYRGYYGV
jgi:UDP-glucuronate 4-epimerase